jgi:hypothetical protein
MDLKENLTNEKVKKKFSSQFELVNYAIKLATNMIMTGRDCRVKIDSQNRAMQILSEILNDKDHFDEIVEEAVTALEEMQPRQEEDRSFSARGAERKRSRKILAE